MAAGGVVGCCVLAHLCFSFLLSEESGWGGISLVVTAWVGGPACGRGYLRR